VFLRIGGLALFVFPTAARERWPSSPARAWFGLPRRVFHGRPVPNRPVSPPVADHPRGRPGIDTTGIIALLGPVAVSEPLILAGETRVAMLTLETPSGYERLTIGDTALDRGVLLGRYDRCDGSHLLKADYISRTHLLIIRVDGVVHAIDTRSTSGTFVLDGPAAEGRQVSVSRLDQPRLIRLTTEPFFLRWRPIEAESERE